jgi:hypothetical protein
MLWIEDMELFLSQQAMDGLLTSLCDHGIIDFTNK